MFLAVYFLNFCIDSPDAHPDSIPEDLSFNDIESVAEFFAEIVFDYKNAFAEHDEADSHEGGSLDISKEYSVNNHSYSLVKRSHGYPVNITFHSADTPFLASLSSDVTSPPPKI